MRMIKRIVTTCILLNACLCLSAQTRTASYEYDACGNRIKATVVDISNKTSNTASPIEEKIDEQDPLTPTVTVYPNPTKGELRVTLTGYTQEQMNVQNNSIKVWDLQGNLILELQPISNNNIVNLLSSKNGVYIMQLMFDKKAKNYKIIKE